MAYIYTVISYQIQKWNKFFNNLFIFHLKHFNKLVYGQLMHITCLDHLNYQFGFHIIELVTTF